MEEVKTKIDVKKSRFSDAPWFETNNINDTPILIGGAGGIGSWTSLLLSRVGFPILLFDDDSVEEVNIAGQFYKVNQIGSSKVEAVAKGIAEYSGTDVDIQAIVSRIDEHTPANDIMISCFDNMAARKTMFDVWLNAVEEGLLGDNPLYIDGRMEAETAQIFFVTPETAERYNTPEYLFDDNAVPDLNCSYKSTSHNGAIIGGYITSGLLNHISNVKYNSKFRAVPFLVEYELPIFSQRKTK